MNFDGMNLDQLGAQAYAHYKAGEKANQKANDHAKSSGLYLAEAKRRIDTEHPYGERTKVWHGFLKSHCPVAPTRAHQLISVATGKTTEEEVKQKTAASVRETRVRAKDESFSLRSEKVQARLHFQSHPISTNGTPS
ncbi:hypothetical protein [Mesorhizobium sp. M0571]|uniref:hypothetical protein n=1 Tax=Mesorhizobium sp. M0571 TaxID=2956960 RepID=UPI0033386621